MNVRVVIIVLAAMVVLGQAQIIPIMPAGKYNHFMNPYELFSVEFFINI